MVKVFAWMVWLGVLALAAVIIIPAVNIAVMSDREVERCRERPLECR